MASKPATLTLPDALPARRRASSILTASSLTQRVSRGLIFDSTEPEPGDAQAAVVAATQHALQTALEHAAREALVAMRRHIGERPAMWCVSTEGAKELASWVMQTQCDEIGLLHSEVCAVFESLLAERQQRK